jgi:hypothetical protein
VIGTYGTVLVICVAALAIGRGIFALSGESNWTWLSPAVGYAGLLAVCAIAVRLPGHGWTAVSVVVALVAASLWIGSRRRGGLPSVDGLIVALAVLGATAIPFIATARIGLLGVSFLNDSSAHLLLAAALQHPELRSFTDYGPGYPVGPHAIVATVGQGLGVSLATAFNGLLIATAVLTGLTALAGLQELPRPPRWAVATLAATLYLSASWYAEGAFKEPIMGLLLFALVLVVWRGRRRGFDKPWRETVPAAVLLAGIVYAYSYTGLAWPAAFVAIWGGAELALRMWRPARRRLLTDLRVRATALVGGGAVFVLGIAPDLGRIHTFAQSQGGAGLGTVGTIAQNNLGNLAGPLSFRESLGIWLRGDFRFWPSDLHQARVLSLFALGVLLLGVVRELIDRNIAIPAALAGCAAVFLYARHTQSPYVAAKALVVPAPLIALAGGRGLFRRVKPPHWGPAMTVALMLVAVPFLVLSFGSSYLALQAAQVGPRDHMLELRSLVPLLHRRPTLVLFHDDFYQSELLPVPASSPAISSPLLPVGFSAQKPWHYASPIDFDSVDAAALDSVDYAITVRTSYASEPPANFHLVTRTRSYELWRRAGPTLPRRVLPEAGAPGAILDCSRPSGRHVAQEQGVARIRARPFVQGLNWVLLPGRSASTTLTLPPGSWEISLAYTSAFGLRVTSGAFHAALPANLDRPGAFWRVGDVRGNARATTVAIAEDDPSPLSAGADVAYVAALAAVSTAPARTVPLSNACGKYLDWYRGSG